jgi:hypothetical protein
VKSVFNEAAKNMTLKASLLKGVDMSHRLFTPVEQYYIEEKAFKLFKQKYPFSHRMCSSCEASVGGDKTKCYNYYKILSFSQKFIQTSQPQS